MAKFCSLFSSSSGNCTYIGASTGGILIDCGVSAKRTEEALDGIGVSPSSISAIFVTHDHCDHYNGVRVFASRYGTKVFASRGTLEGLDGCGVLNGKFDAFVLPEKGYEIAGMRVKSFPIFHDAQEPTGFCILTPDCKRIAILTDTGIITPEIENAVLGSDLVLLESNHDVQMLMMGSYPYATKQRILSDQGHLCNEVAAQFAKKLFENGTTRIVLGHLSKENNMPSLAYQTTKTALDELSAVEGEDYILQVASNYNKPISF